MKRISMQMAAMLMGAGVSGAASAQVTYDYVGSPFSVATDYITTSDFLSGSVTLSSALGDNLHNVSVSPTQYDFSNGLVGIASGDGGGLSLSFSTNASGKITGWNLFGVVDANEFTSTGPGCHPVCDQTTGDPGLGQSTVAGVWTQVVSAPEIDGASAASGVALLACGLLVVRGRRQRSLAA